jgi:hypothetical protein
VKPGKARGKYQGDNNKLTLQKQFVGLAEPRRKRTWKPAGRKTQAADVSSHGEEEYEHFAAFAICWDYSEYDDAAAPHQHRVESWCSRKSTIGRQSPNHSKRNTRLCSPKESSSGPTSTPEGIIIASLATLRIGTSCHDALRLEPVQHESHDPGSLGRTHPPGRSMSAGGARH